MMEHHFSCIKRSDVTEIAEITQMLHLKYLEQKKLSKTLLSDLVNGSHSGK